MNINGALLGVLAFGLAAAPAAAQTITEFPVPAQSPLGITAGPDGALWFTVAGSIGNNNPIDRITTTGAVSQFPAGNVGAGYILTGPDGALWSIGSGASHDPIIRLSTSGNVTTFSIPSASSNYFGNYMAVGPDGAIWFTEYSNNKIGRITTAGQITEYPGDSNVPGGYAQSPSGITTGPDGALWFVDLLGIGRITSSGTISHPFLANDPVKNTGFAIVLGPDGAFWITGRTSGGGPAILRATTGGAGSSFPLPHPQNTAGDLAVGPDGALWFIESGPQGTIGRIDMTGQITEFPVAGNGEYLQNITAGPDGAMWFGDSSAIGRITVPAGGSPLAAAVLPSSRSVVVGGTATVFATMINAGSAAASGCAIDLLGGVPASFSFQATSPSTNAPIGTPNTPVTIAAGGSQTFVLSLTPSASLAPTLLNFGFDCTSTAAAATSPGLNTVLLSAATAPTPDIVALAATAKSDGIVHVLNGAGAFAVASVNLGSGGMIMATAGTGSGALHVSIALCQTNPSSGACLAPAASSVTTTIDAQATPTFAVFVAANDSIPFQPGANRIFVTFSDAGGAVRGSTSVAVETQ